MKNLSILLILAFSTTILAQTTTVGVAPFGYSSRSSDQAVVEMVHQAITEELSCNADISLLDRTAWGAITQERERQSGLDFRNSSTYAQGRSLGADVIVDGYVAETSVQLNEATGDAEYVIRLNIDVIDVEKGQTVAGGSKLFLISESSSAAQIGKVGTLAAGTTLFNRKKDRASSVSADVVLTTETLSGVGKDAMEATLKRLQKEFQNFIEDPIPGSYCKNTMNVADVLPDKIRLSKRPIDKHFEYFLVNGPTLYVQGNKDTYVKKSWKYVLVMETEYREETGNGEVMEGTTVDILSELKVDDYDGDRTRLIATDKKHDLQGIIDDAKGGNKAARSVSEPEFYVMYQMDVK